MTVYSFETTTFLENLYADNPSNFFIDYLYIIYTSFINTLFIHYLCIFQPSSSHIYIYLPDPI